MSRIARAACLVLVTGVLGTTTAAYAQSADGNDPSGTMGPRGNVSPPTPVRPQSAAPAPLQGPAADPRGQGTGVAVLGVTGARDEAFALARAIYGSRLRPPTLDEVRARVLAGDPPPATASRELRELAEIRAGIRGEDAASRRLLAGIAQQVGAQALLVVRVEDGPAAAPPAPAPATTGAAPDADGGAGAAPAADPAPAPAPTPTPRRVVARLVLVEGAEIDAAQYTPDPDGSWRGTVASLERRFPGVTRTAAPAAASQPVPTAPAEEKSRPFYTSGWFWGAIGAAALLGGAFYLASRDTSSDSIHVEMRVPK